MTLSPYGDDKKNCSGCGACEQICTRESISMQPDAEGFEYPVVDQETCNDCGLCIRICPITNHWKNKSVFETPEVYAALHNAEGVRSRSASGGIFPALAHDIMQQKGIVFGAAFDSQFQIHHVGVETDSELEPLLGSKYVQSIIGDTFRQTRAALKSGRPVLFTGTPCQIAGLYGYLQRDYENLYSCDLFCHGIPSPKVFRKYIESLEQSHHAAVTQYKFRSKYFGWRSYGIQITFSNGEIVNMTNQQDPYTIGFLENLYLRPMCSVCPFTSVHRPADITIGDFWGIEKYMPELDDDKGISAILVNTLKGRKIFERCQPGMKTRLSGVPQVLQPSLTSPSVSSANRSAFFADLDQHSFSDLQHTYISGFRPTVRRQLGRVKQRIIKAFDKVAKTTKR